MSAPKIDIADLYRERRDVLEAVDSAVSTTITNLPKHELSESTPLSVVDCLRSTSFSTPQKTFSTGFADLDALICGGAKARQVLTVAAPTGSGKTGWATSIALNMARASVPILFVTTEIDDEEQAARFGAIACRELGQNVTPDDFLSNRVPASCAVARLDGLPIYLLNLDEPTTDAFVIIAAHAKTIAAAHGAMPVIFIDYLQVLAVEDEEHRRLSVTQVSTRARRLARDLDTAIIAISSVSRAYYGRNRKKASDTGEEDPIDWLAAAKESGDIEYSSAVFCYLDTAAEITLLDESLSRLIVAKSRRGRRGFVGLRFHGPSGHFRAASESVEAMRPTKANGPCDLDRVLEYLRKHQVDPPTKEKVRGSIKGVGVQRVSDAIKIGLDEGLIEERKVEVVNKRGSLRPKTVLVIPDSISKEGADV